MPLRCTICQCVVGPAAFLGRLGVCPFLPMAGDSDNAHGMLMQAFEGFTVFHNIPAAVQVKQDFSLKDWDEGTLDDMGCYTPQSDIYQIGVMLLKSRCLSADGLIFAQKLKSKTIDAFAAAEDPYLQTPIPMCEGGPHLQ